MSTFSEAYLQEFYVIFKFWRSFVFISSQKFDLCLTLWEENAIPRVGTSNLGATCSPKEAVVYVKLRKSIPKTRVKYDYRHFLYRVRTLRDRR